jgi:hypothetical protein
LELEINGIEEKINILKEESINGGQKDLLKNFIKSKKQSLKDKENQELEDKV